MANLWLAFRFLTILPLGRVSLAHSRVGVAAMWFPLVGGVLGGMLAALAFGFERLLLLPNVVASALLLAAWAWLTGGLHLDGVADCGDGLFVSASAERRLEIIQDPRLGAFGAMALFFALLIKAAALYAIPQKALAITMAVVLSRWVIIPIAFLYPAARSQGLAETLHRELTPLTWKVTLLYPILFIAIGGWPAVVIAAIVAGVAWGWARVANRRLGGMTGDVYGLIIESAEIVALLTTVTLTAHGIWID